MRTADPAQVEPDRPRLFLTAIDGLLGHWLHLCMHAEAGVHDVDRAPQALLHTVFAHDGAPPRHSCRHTAIAEHDDVGGVEQQCDATWRHEGVFAAQLWAGMHTF